MNDALDEFKASLEKGIVDDDDADDDDVVVDDDDDDEDDVPVLMKYAVGKFRKADRSAILSKINPLVDEMTDEE